MLAGGLAAVAGGCQPGPDLAEGETGRVVRAPDGDLLMLDGGLPVRLSEIEAPALGGDPQPFAAEARSMLVHAAMGRPVRLYYGGLSRDRYERAIAHVIVQTAADGDLWLNGYMARQGGGRVRSWPDNSRRVRQLYALEEEARRKRRGLWALDAYRVRAPDDLAGTDGLVVVEGPLTAIREAEDRAAVRLTPSGLEVETDGALGRPSGLSLTRGRLVRVRGRIDRRLDPPSIRLTHWGQVETP